ncbi:MAG: DUF72 domain-containing protein [Candidatus Hodarchaeales archaeon]
MMSEDKVLIGTSGFFYSDWVQGDKNTRIPFYPEYLNKDQRLVYYSEIFPTVEINSTFYHFPRQNIVTRWEKLSPKNFIFSYKIPKLITHTKKLKEDYWNDLMNFLQIMGSLRRKQGPALLQLPPKFSYSYFKNLKIFLKNWPDNLKLVVEFREKSWVNNINLGKTLSLLSKYNACYCIVDEPLLPPITPVTSDFSYIRFHGHGLKLWYNYDYSMKELSNWAPKINKLTHQTQEVFTYFNNHPAGSAPSNARQLAVLLKVRLKNPETIDIVKVRQRSGDLPQHTLDRFLHSNNPNDISLEEYVRYCSSCGTIILKDDNFCENCGVPLEKE